MAFLEPQGSNRPQLANFNDLYTPPEWFAYILPYLPKDGVYWEMCYGQGHLATEMRKRWFKVIGDAEWDCFEVNPDCDYVITNPPYRNNKAFVKRALETWKPFALLIRLEHLGWVEAFEVFKDLDVEILIPKRRIKFITPKTYWNWKTKESSPTFHTIWVTKGFNIGKQITYVDIPEGWEPIHD